MIPNLIELRNRLGYLLVTLISTILLSFAYKESVLYLLVKSSLFQIKNELPFFIYTNLTEVFSTYFKLSIITGIYVTFPIFFLHIWFFINPGLYQSEYRSARKIFLIFTYLWLLNNFLTYHFVLPWVWNFFLQFGNNASESPLSLFFEIKLAEYMDFLISIITCFSLSFQLFVTILLWILHNSQYDLFLFTKNRRFVYTITLLFAALITPPDLLSQLIFTGPLLTIYELLLLNLLIKNEYSFQSGHLKTGINKVL